MAIETALPLIDFGAFGNGDSEAARDIAQQMLKASQTRGFFYLANHGVSQDKINNMFEHSKRFFAIPRDVRESVRRPPSGFDARGWVRPGSGNITQGIWDKDAVLEAQKESASEFELYLVGNKRHPTLRNRLLSESLMPGFAEDAEEFLNECNRAYRRILKALALALGLDRDFFEKFHKNGGESTFSLNHSSAGSTDLFKKGRFGAHTDYGYVTLLFQGDIGGLEVADNGKGGDFVPAPPIPGAAIINIGDLMERWSNDTLRSTMHVVRTPPHLVVDGQVPERFSIPFFGAPDPDTVVETIPTCCTAENPNKYEAINGRQYIIRRQDLQYNNNTVKTAI